eukprot:scaffold337778_cov45-Prasinocladus_malaysianus.AAC.1
MAVTMHAIILRRPQHLVMSTANDDALQNTNVSDPNGPVSLHSTTSSPPCSRRSIFDADNAPFRPGDKVIVGNRRRLQGTIRYFGPTMFAAGEWVGMELELPEGKNDGTVQ